MAKLAFNGYHVTYWNHETRRVEKQSFATTKEVMNRGWEKHGEPFPSPEVFAEDLFNVFGDCVGEIVDNAGVVLLNNLVEMNDLNTEMSRY